MSLNVSSVKFGMSCEIGPDVYFGHPTIIGNHVTIGRGTTFANDKARSRLTIRESGWTVVEDGVIIGANVTIVGNTKIKKGAVIADGSVVIGHVFSETFVAGNPARKIYSLSTIHG